MAAAVTQRVSACMDKTLERLQQKQEDELFYEVAAGDLLTQQACPLCDSGNIASVSEIAFAGGPMFFATGICRDCLHVFRSTAPRRQWFQQRWAQISTGKLEVFNPSLEQERVTRYKHYYSLLSKYLRAGKLLDIGAAYGSGAKLFARRGFDVEAVEPEDDRARYINEAQGIKAHHSALEDLRLPAGSFDVILFAHCLEHLDDPVATLSQLKEWLHPERGIIYLEVPLLWNVVDWRDAFFMAHKHNFTEENLEKLAARLGLRVIEKFLVPDSEGDFDNIGMLLTPGKGYGQAATSPLCPAKGGVEAVAALYRRDMPHAGALKRDEILRYRVPYMNHFYYIVRMQQGEIRPEGGANCFTFVRTAA